MVVAVVFVGVVVVAVVVAVFVVSVAHLLVFMYYHTFIHAFIITCTYYVCFFTHAVLVTSIAVFVSSHMRLCSCEYIFLTPFFRFAGLLSADVAREREGNVERYRVNIY